jgi:flagellar biosynthesis/type III secretory pathway protein FliH
VATIIKAEHAPRLGSRPEGLHLGDFLAEGQQIVAAARAKAETIIAEAKLKAERLGREAQRKGYETGYQKGSEEGRQAGERQAMDKANAEFQAQHVQLASACEAIFREVDRQKRELLLAAHRDLLLLAVTIAERVTKRLGVIDGRTVTENMLSVIDRIGECTDLVVEVSPRDSETLKRFAPDLIARRSSLKHVEVKVNDAIAPGGCLVRTQGGWIDATLDTQIRRIAAELVPDPDRPFESGSLDQRRDAQEAGS